MVLIKDILVNVRLGGNRMKQTITFGRNGKRYSVDVDMKEVTNMTFKEMEDYAWEKLKKSDNKYAGSESNAKN